MRKLIEVNKAPVFLLGFMTLHPKYRNDVVFAVAFFTVRILFHVVLGVSYFLHDNRAQATGGSYIPSLILASVFPLHVIWFRGCIMGFYRRASRRTPVSTLAEPKVLPEESCQRFSIARATGKTRSLQAVLVDSLTGAILDRLIPHHHTL